MLLPNRPASTCLPHEAVWQQQKVTVQEAINQQSTLKSSS